MVDKVTQLLVENNIDFLTIEALPPSGGDRLYYRIKLKDITTLIATYSENIVENNTFFAFSKVLENNKVPMPNIIATSADNTTYLQQDLGATCLLDIVLENHWIDSTIVLYKKALKQLAHCQVKAYATIPYELCLGKPKFDTAAALFDLEYCVQYFAKPKHIVIDKSIEQEFKNISTIIGTFTPHYFMYRDCQGRNIMVQNGDIYFIDYQGGMQGPPLYDVVSLLWQAKAAMPAHVKNILLNYYIEELLTLIPNTITKQVLLHQYSWLTFSRLFQVLGAYGRRGLIEGKKHFIESIPLGINNLKEWLAQNELLLEKYPTTKQLILQIIK